MAGKAIELLINNESGKCVCLKNSEIVAMGIEEALKETNQSKELLYQLFEDLVQLLLRLNSNKYDFVKEFDIIAIH